MPPSTMRRSPTTSWLRPGSLRPRRVVDQHGRHGANVTIRNSLITGHTGDAGSAVEVFSKNAATFAGGLFTGNTWNTSRGNPNQGQNIGTINGHRRWARRTRSMCRRVRPTTTIISNSARRRATRPPVRSRRWTSTTSPAAMAARTTAPTRQPVPPRDTCAWASPGRLKARALPAVRRIAAHRLVAPRPYRHFPRRMLHFGVWLKPNRQPLPALLAVTSSFLSGMGRKSSPTACARSTLTVASFLARRRCRR